MSYRLLVILHLLGAAVWVGGHLVSCLSVLPRALRAGDPGPVREFAWHIVAVTGIAVAMLVVGVGIRTGGLW